MATSRTIALGAGGSGGGAMTLLGTATVAGAAATTLTLSELNLSAYKAFFATFRLDNATGSAANISLYYNADTTATNYYVQSVSGSNTTVSGARGNSAILATMDANETLTWTATIVNDLDGRPRAFLHLSDGAAASVVMHVESHVWTSATNITGITLSSAIASSLAIGSTFSVWGIT